MDNYLVAIAKCGTCGCEINRAEHVPTSDKEGVGLLAGEVSFCKEIQHNTGVKCNTNFTLDWHTETPEDYQKWLEGRGYLPNYSQATIERLEAARLALSVSGDLKMEDLLQEDNAVKFRDLVTDGIRSLQSLDDLGSARANKEVWDNMEQLERILRALDKLIAKLKEMSQVGAVSSFPGIWRETEGSV